MTTVGPVQVLLVLVRLVLVPPVLAGEEVSAVLPVPVVPLALMVLPVLLVPLVSLVLMVVLMLLPLVVLLVLLVLLVRAMALPGRETARLPATRTALVSAAMVLPKAVLLKVAGSQVLASQVLVPQVCPVNIRTLLRVRVTRDRPGRMPPRPMGQVRVARGA